MNGHRNEPLDRGSADDADGNSTPEMRPRREAAIRALVIEQLGETRERKARWHRNRWFAWSGLGVLVVGIGATAAGVVLQAQTVSNEQVVHCLLSDERAADGSYPGSMGSLASADGEARAVEAVEACTMMWQQGAMEPGFNPRSATNAPGEVPEAFVVCVMPDGSAAAVPSSEPAVCQRLGLAPLDDGE
ncbi:hypothetical protein [Agromyces laixinhei]|uniref:hypothetical protein n=1 Tax=Agromyces laixinhei TaxID=2585717 RepID=UPI0012EDE2C5|nr:hypothetical protein [Agromyces laixinhei]